MYDPYFAGLEGVTTTVQTQEARRTPSGDRVKRNCSKGYFTVMERREPTQKNNIGRQSLRLL